MTHSGFSEFGGRVDMLWREYVGPDGTSGLRQRDIDLPKWRKGVCTIGCVPSCTLITALFHRSQVTRFLETFTTINAFFTARLRDNGKKKIR